LQAGLGQPVYKGHFVIGGDRPNLHLKAIPGSDFCNDDAFRIIHVPPPISLSI
jgi:hypothetical protein